MSGSYSHSKRPTSVSEAAEARSVSVNLCAFRRKRIMTPASWTRLRRSGAKTVVSPWWNSASGSDSGYGSVAIQASARDAQEPASFPRIPISKHMRRGARYEETSAVAAIRPR